MSAQDLVTIDSFEFLAEAQVAQMHLEAAGIDSFLADAGIVSANWLLGNAVGYVKLQVSQHQVDAAKDVLAPSLPNNDGTSADHSETEPFSEVNSADSTEVRPMEMLRSMRKAILLLVVLGPILLLLGLGLLSVLIDFLIALGRWIGVVS